MISAKQLAAWLHGLSPDEASRAVLGVGVEPSELGRASADATIGRPRIVRWRLSEESFRHLSEVDPKVYAGLVPETGGLRLAIHAEADEHPLVERLLRRPEVASAFVAVERPANALRRRAWGWPLRVGLLGFDVGDAEKLTDAASAQRGYVRQMLEIRRIEDEPGAVDIAVVRGSPSDALAHLRRLRPVANLVVFLAARDKPSRRLEKELADARARTAAGASVVVDHTDLPRFLERLVTEFSHAAPLDVALTTAGERDLVLWAEPEMLEHASLPDIAFRDATELDVVRFTFEHPPPAIEMRGAIRDVAKGMFLGESHEATRLLALRSDVEPALEALVEERWCQAYVGEGGDNVIREGVNPVTVFIGPLEPGALAASRAFDERVLDWEERDSFRLTVAFVPAGPNAEAQRADVDLPRFGRSANLPFELDIPDGAKRAAARIVVLFRNRILQTAVLRGRVGEPAKLDEAVGLVPRLANLDDRRAFDVALLANHVDGRASLTRFSDEGVAISGAAGVPGIAGNIADVLAAAAETKYPTKGGLGSKAARRLLVDLAVEGRDLFDELSVELAGFAEASRIQIVSARSTWFLPLEAAYSRDAPDDDATICERYLADTSSCDGCCTPPDDTTKLCPNAFWGLSKTIERYTYDPKVDASLKQGHEVFGRRQPRRGQRELAVNRALFAASSRVDSADCAETVKAIGHNASAVKGWSEWQKELKAKDTELLVLLPHTDYAKRTLEVTKATLRRGRIREGYVTGGRKVEPILILFGCRTVGTSGDPSGFAMRFHQKGASAVFHSTTDLLNAHAAELARRLVKHLTNRGARPRLLSDSLTEFRREAVRDGYVVALGIAALGDADWKL
jgi:hypothetical protein